MRRCVRVLPMLVALFLVLVHSGYGDTRSEIGLFTGLSRYSITPNGVGDGMMGLTGLGYGLMVGLNQSSDFDDQAHLRPNLSIRPANKFWGGLVGGFAFTSNIRLNSLDNSFPVSMILPYVGLAFEIRPDARPIPNGVRASTPALLGDWGVRFGYNGMFHSGTEYTVFRDVTLLVEGGFCHEVHAGFLYQSFLASLHYTRMPFNTLFEGQADLQSIGLRVAFIHSF